MFGVESCYVLPVLSNFAFVPFRALSALLLRGCYSLRLLVSRQLFVRKLHQVNMYRANWPLRVYAWLPCLQSILFNRLTDSCRAHFFRSAWHNISSLSQRPDILHSLQGILAEGSDSASAVRKDSRASVAIEGNYVLGCQLPS